MTDSKATLMASLTGEVLPAPETTAPVENGATENGRTESPDQDLFGDIPVDDNGGQEIIPPGPPAAAAAAAAASVVPNPLTMPSGPPPQPPAAAPPPEPLLVAPPAPAAKASTASLLMASGLLGVANGSVDASSGGGSGGGLFDEVDKEEEERLRKEEEERKRKEEEERLRREAAEAERKRQEEAEAQRQAQIQAQLLAQQQQQQMQMQQQSLVQSYMGPPMQTIPLQAPPPAMAQSVMQQPMAGFSLQQSQHTMQPSLAQSVPALPTQQIVGQMQNMGLNTQTAVAPTTPAAAASGGNLSFAERSRMMQEQAVVNQQLQRQQIATPAPPTINTFSPAGFYRDHAPPVPSAVAAAPTPTNQQQYSISQTGGPVQTHTISPASRLPKQAIQPSVTAGMHNRAQFAPKVAVTAPQPFEPLYGQVTVNEPLLVQPPSLFNVVPPHWTYQVTTTLKEGGCWMVRRRFRHVDAMQERLRKECPGAILPPRPDKHATRAIEEASALQSAEFAMQRAAEIQVYLNALVHHPFAGRASSLKLFLALQDDMGTAWPEVSNNAITRLGAVSAGAASKVNQQNPLWDQNDGSALEDNAELLALASSEGLRMGAVTHAVPKLEGAVTLMREHGEIGGAVGMELNKLGKEVETSDRDLGVPIEILSQGLLRGGRRTKRLALELSAAVNPFLLQYKLCKMEKAAFSDRRQALQKRVKERGRADIRAQQLMIHQRSYQTQGQLGSLDRMERDATLSDEVAVEAVHYCDIIGNTLKSEVNRVAYLRRTEWSQSMKVVCSSMKEASTEQRAIWESTKEAFLQAFPEYNTSN